MSTFLIISISPRKEVELKEVEILDEEHLDVFEALKPHIDPPYSGKSIVVNKKDIRTFKLNCSVVEARS